MPAEWEPHAATWLAWPHYHGDWPGKFEPIPWVYAEIIRNLAKHERVELIVNDASAARQARRVLEQADALSANIRFHRWPTNRVWLRDSGCIFLARGRTDVGPGLRPGQAEQSSAALALKFRFNAWAKYSNWRHDEKIGSLMAKAPLLAQNTREKWHPRKLYTKKSTHSPAASASCSKADRSTSTEPAPSSPPKNACSARCRNAILTWRACTTKRPLPTTWARRTPSGWVAASSATIPTATSMTSPASSRETPSSPWLSPTPTT